jgi:hypothetical protein
VEFEFEAEKTRPGGKVGSGRPSWNCDGGLNQEIFLELTRDNAPGKKSS